MVVVAKTFKLQQSYIAKQSADWSRFGQNAQKRFREIALTGNAEAGHRTRIHSRANLCTFLAVDLM